MGIGHAFLAVYLRTNVHVAFATSSLLLLSGYYADHAVSTDLIALVFCGTILGYSALKGNALAIQGSAYERGLQWSIHLTCIVFLAFYGWQQSAGFYWVTALCVTLMFLYAGGVWIFKGLRHIAILKMLAVVLVWTLVTYVFIFVQRPDLQHSNQHIVFSFYGFKWIDFFKRALLVYALYIPFEIRDLKYDAISLNTLPQWIGVRLTKWTGYFALIAMILLVVVDGEQLYTTQYLEISIAGIVAVAIAFATPQKADWYASFYVEGIPVLWLLGYWVLK